MTSEIVFVDTETTGLDPERHELWEIALIEADGTEWTWRLRPKSPALADPAALRLIKFYERTAAEDWRWSTADREDIAAQIALLTAGKHLVGAVPWFDAGFLAEFLIANGQREAWHYHMIDVETLAVGWLAGGAGRLWSPERAEPPRSSYQPPWKSHALGFTLGVPNEAEHTALGDARWAKAMYEAVMGVS